MRWRGSIALSRSLGLCPRPASLSAGRWPVWRGRREWILGAGSAQPANLTALDQQLIHGDYQDTNLFFEHGQVSAIIDWDQTYLAAREWEVVRTMHLV